MIFVSLGTQKFQFNRLLKYIDEMIESGEIVDTVFAQIGHSTYLPKNYSYERFLTQQDFENNIEKCNLYITHGGIGSINTGVKHHKRIIACPRQSSFNEHVDDHQSQITQKFDELGFLKQALDKLTLKQSIDDMAFFTPKEIKPCLNDSDSIIIEVSKFLKNNC